MPNEPVITRTKIIVVVSKEINEYGDILFWDKEGKEYKINVKRAHLGENIIPERATEVFWSQYKGREYICGAKLIADQLLGPTPTPTPTPPTKPEPVSPVNPQELGMWWKELGNRIGDGSIEKDWPKSYVKIKLQYYRKMAQITGIAFMPEAQKKVSDEP